MCCPLVAAPVIAASCSTVTDASIVAVGDSCEPALLRFASPAAAAAAATACLQHRSGASKGIAEASAALTDDSTDSSTIAAAFLPVGAGATASAAADDSKALQLDGERLIPVAHLSDHWCIGEPIILAAAEDDDSAEEDSGVHGAVAPPSGLCIGAGGGAAGAGRVSNDVLMSALCDMLADSGCALLASSKRELESGRPAVGTLFYAVRAAADGRALLLRRWERIRSVGWFASYTWNNASNVFYAELAVETCRPLHTPGNCYLFSLAPRRLHS